jgi:hypothetical protein
MGTKPKGPLKPGTPAPVSGQVKVPGSPYEVTVIEGKPLPPTPNPGHGYLVVDPTKHKPKVEPLGAATPAALVRFWGWA